MIIESHAHYSHYKFEQGFRHLSYKNGLFSIDESNRENLFTDLKVSGIKASVEPAIGIESNEKIYSLSLLYPDFIYPAYGCHPTRTFLAKWKNRKAIDKYASSDKCIAIGETGLDYHYNRKEQHRLCQKRWFRYQIKLAYKLKKPLILHIRKASGDALKILTKNKKRLSGGVVHCFCDDYMVAQAYINLGLHIGIGAALLTDENKCKLTEAIKHIPLERIIVETDAPYVLPDTDIFKTKKKKRKVRNSSTVIYAVIEQIAKIKGMSTSQVEETVYNNAIKLFSLNLK